MEFCLIKLKMQRLPVLWQELYDNGIPLKRSKAVFGIDHKTAGWPSNCPNTTCGEDLMITSCGTHLTLWCPACGWVPKYGAPKSRYLTTKEAAKEYGYTPAVWSTLCAREEINARMFKPKGKRSQWFISIEAIEWMLDTGGFDLQWKTTNRAIA